METLCRCGISSLGHKRFVRVVDDNPTKPFGSAPK
jgi:hypothetical protein